MKKMLTKTDAGLWHYVDGARVEGKNPDMEGNCSDLWGDLDSCEITEEDRSKGLNIAELIEAEEGEK